MRSLQAFFKLFPISIEVFRTIFRELKYVNVIWVQEGFLGGFAESIVTADQPEKSMGVQQHLHSM